MSASSALIDPAVYDAHARPTLERAERQVEQARQVARQADASRAVPRLGIRPVGDTRAALAVARHWGLPESLPKTLRRPAVTTSIRLIWWSLICIRLKKLYVPLQKKN